MRRGSAFALVTALISAMACAQAARADADTSDLHRLYDRGTDCAVFDTPAFPAGRATWDGPCRRGLADGRGTATYFGKNDISLSLSAQFADGVAVDGKAEIAWSDGAHYSGLTVDGAPSGAGVLRDAKGNRFDGEWKDGALNGHGSVVWANGDRYDGEWLNGKAEGHGVQVWADGQKYDGPWHNDQPNGQGTVTRKDGSSFAALFVDGKRAPDAAAAAPVAAAPVATAAVPAQFFDSFAGRTLAALDGSTVAFTSGEGGFVRTITGPDGTVQKAAFIALGNGLGSISDAGRPPQVRGVFRPAANGIEADYADGHSEWLSRVSDGLAITLKSASGEQACAAWYPAGHVFSAEERKAAVAAYARRLGVSDGTAPPRTSCALEAAEPAGPRPMPMAKPRRTHAPSQSALTGPATPAAASGLETVPVRPSTVHLIDGPAGDAADALPADAPPTDEAIASNCLKIDSDGAYWGFRNHCGYTVQFAYCLLHGTDRLTACDGAASVPGSVSANGFGALFADDSLGERGVEHNFRWVGCRGGAGEVTAHLEAPDPASGRCVRGARTLARGN
ncbi:MAG: hypothetical protein WDM91_21800 [Rhizomicrobium sp.]